MGEKVYAGFVPTVRDSVRVEDVILRYAKTAVKRNNFSCPFHGIDKHPSARVKNNRFTCYTCGEFGDSVDFVAKLFNISVKDAAITINADFHLGLTKKKITKKQLKEIRRLQEKKIEARERPYKLLNRLCNIEAEYSRIIRDCAPKSISELEDASSRWVFAVKNIDYIRYLIGIQEIRIFEKESAARANLQKRK